MPNEFQPHGETMSLADAVNALTSAPEPEKPTAETPVPAAETREEAPVLAVEETPTAEAAEEKPVVGDTTATEDGEDEQGSLPPIEPPSSWNAEEKEAFKSSPRKAQEAILRREQDRDKALRDAQNTAADQRKTVDGEVTRLKGMAEKMEGVINEAVDSIAKDFPSIKTQADIDRLAATDPAEFAKFQAALMRVNALEQQKADAQREITSRETKARNEAVRRDLTELQKHFPTWTDTKARDKDMGEIIDFAIKNGADPAAARATHDPFIIRMAHKAMLYDRAQAAAKAAVNRDAPTTLKPGAVSTTPKADKVAAERKAQLAKLDKSGDIEDALALMMEPARRR